ncbi:hypothetical protein MNBD_GAMMA23-2439 [hydrothermal vent metagenome]|uniref:ApeI dehydratase-like domain-containing protein n=1 Tax=hydrothermal vent metagenome TaxID=652676 RepID=A0A3B1AFE5_9ZZZZ
MPSTPISFHIKKDHPCLAGHFPGNPIVPGVVILDEVASIILQHNRMFKITGFTSVKFTQPLFAEQEVSVELSDKALVCTGHSKIKFSVYNSGELMAQGEIKLEEQGSVG